ncbi:hypothetical protein ASG32_31285 [Methylobacterium sp. Leaf361]|nr:hypothetical protein ASG32_31285 [Methylobacterium sp. Leaf361]
MSRQVGGGEHIDFDAFATVVELQTRKSQICAPAGLDEFAPGDPFEPAAVEAGELMMVGATGSQRAVSGEVGRHDALMPR